MDHGNSPVTDAETPPIGIKIICVVLGFVGFHLFWEANRSLMAGRGVAYIAFPLTIGFLVALYGLLTLESWGWAWTMVFLAFGGLLGLLFVETIAGIVLVVLGTLALLGYVWSKRPLYLD